ncbi:MAG: DnaJ domain-containing protein [Phycisphaerae bacterium]|nr:DnaJ domain-containing protein [Phycisphaerae bacterium]
MNRRHCEPLSVTKAYAVLGLMPYANSESVRSMYRRLVLRHHPDRGGNVERFKELTTAYRVLQQKFELDQETHAGLCDQCGNYQVLHRSFDGSHYCFTCWMRAGRRRSLPAPPVVMATCATTIVLLCLAIGCLVASWASQGTRGSQFAFAAIVLAIMSLISLAITCLTVLYTAKPTRLIRHRGRK